MPGTITPIWRRNGESNQDVGIMLHIIPAYCPQLGPIERLWDLMHLQSPTTRVMPPLTKQFSETVLTFLREDGPRKRRSSCDAASDNFRIISPIGFRVPA